MVPAINKAVADRFAPLKRGVALGLITVGGPVGGVIAGLLLPALAHEWGWQRGFLTLAIIAFLTAILPRIGFRASPLVGHGENRPSSVITHGFWKIILWIGSAYFFMSMGIYAASAFLTLFLIDSVGIAYIWAGFYFGLAQGGSALGRLLWGKIADGPFKYKREHLLAIIALIAGCAFFLVTRIDQTTSLMVIGIVMILVGLSSLASWGVLFTLLPDVFGREATSLATSIVLAISWGGGVCGTILFGIILDQTHSYDFAFYSLALLSILSAIILYIPSKTRSFDAHNLTSR